MKRTLSFKNKWLGLNPKSCTRQNIRVSKIQNMKSLKVPNIKTTNLQSRQFATTKLSLFKTLCFRSDSSMSRPLMSATNLYSIKGDRVFKTLVSPTKKVSIRHYGEPNTRTILAEILQEWDSMGWYGKGWCVCILVGGVLGAGFGVGNMMSVGPMGLLILPFCLAYGLVVGFAVGIGWPILVPAIIYLFWVFSK